MNYEELYDKNKGKIHSFIAVVILLILGLGDNDISDLSPEGVQYHKATAFAGNITSVTDDTFYEIADTTELSGTSRELSAFTILSAVHSSKTPADYDDTICGVYWNTTLIANVSQFNNWVVEFETERTDNEVSGKNLTLLCNGLGNSGSDTVRYDIAYVFNER